MTTVEQALDDAVADGAAIDRLAALDPIEYDRVRQQEADRLKVRVGTLDRLVNSKRPRVATDTGSGTPLDIEDPEPWGQPVDGALLLDDIERELTGLVVMAVEAGAAVALWTAFTFTIDTGQFAPRLLVKSPEKRCGKTTLLEALIELCRRALPASNISAPALFRTVEKVQPTIILDEAETFVRDDEQLRGLINSGHRRSLAFVIRTVEIGGDFEPRRFSTWCPMVIAGIGDLHGTIEDRSVIVELQRKMSGQKVARLDEAARGRLRVLARKVRRWADDHIEELRGANPTTPPELHDRAADNWRPLLAIADAAGGEWPRRAREAARKLSGGSDKATFRVLLLADLRTIFGDGPAPEWMASKKLLEDLVALEERPWAEWGRGGKPLTSQAFRSLLEGFKIYSSHNSDKTARGYKRDAFADAWARYLPPAGVPDPAGNESIRPSVRNPDGAKDSREPASVRVTDGLDGSGLPGMPLGHPIPDGWTDAAAGAEEEMVI